MMKILKGTRTGRAKAFSIVLTILLAVGLAAAGVAFAHPAPIPVDPNTYAEFTKVVERPMGVQEPDIGFNFSATPYAFNDGAVAGVNFPAVPSVTLGMEDGVLPDAWTRTVPEAEWGINSIDRSFRFDLAGLAFDRTGTFDYLVETQDINHADVANPAEQFILRLTVGAGNEITNVTILDYDRGTVGAELDDPRFVSVYTPVGGLTVRNYVTGDYGDPNASFDYRIRLTSTSFDDFDGTVEAVITDYGGANISTHTITNNRWYSFSMQHGEVMTFEELPQGTAFMVEERAATAFTPSVSVVINDGIPWKYTAILSDRALSSEAALGQSFLVENRVVGPELNEVTFTQYMPESANAHVLMDNLIWIILVAGVAFVGFVAVVWFIRSRG